MTQNPELLIGQPYDIDALQGYDWAGCWPLVTVNADGTVGTIDEIVYGTDNDAARWALVDITDGRVSSVGTGYENHAAALVSELRDAGIAVDAE